MRRRILLADDHAGIRQRLRSILESAGFEICGEAINGLDALEKATALLPDLIILNVSMPVMNGFEAIQKIKKCAPGTKIVIFSAHDSDELQREAIRRGASSYVSKSGGITELLDEIGRLLT